MAHQRPWIYLQNPILNVTEGSYRLAVRISKKHLDSLKSKVGDPLFDALITAYEPLDTALANAYSAWKGMGGSQLGDSLSLKNLLQLLRNTKIQKWDIAIQALYDAHSPEYKKLLPQGRSSFQNGSQTDIITALKTLANVTAAIPALSTIAAEVNAFYTQLLAAFNTQKSSLTGTKTSSDAVEAARVAMCIGQYANLGALIQHYANTPEQVEPYFDLAALRDGSQVIYTGSIKPGSFKNILVHSFAPTDGLKLSAEGSVKDLHFYLASQKEEAPNGTVVIVPAGQTVTVAASQLGAVGNRFLNISNPDMAIKGSWVVEFL